MAGVKWTKDQLRAICDRGGTLLVSAAAGSGKTAVLVERLLRRVVDEKIDIDRFLLITYTNAAASELRGKIMDALIARIAEKPENRHLSRQMTLLYNAKISTVHAYCMGVLRTHGHMLGLSSDFKIMDEDEADILRRTILDDLLEEKYAMGEESFALLVEALCSERDDRRMVETILSLHGKSRSHPAPQKWMALRREDYQLENTCDVGETHWGKLILSHIKEIANYLHSRLESAICEMQDDEVISTAYLPMFTQDLHALKQVCMQETWDGAYCAVHEIPFERLGSVRKAEDIALKERVVVVRNDIKKEVARLKQQLLIKDSKALLEELSQSAPVICSLLDIVEALDARYLVEKKRRGLLDYGDLEHYAVELFVENFDEENNIVVPTPFAREISQEFCEIMVDEYQDSNCLQDIIFRAISQNEKNLVMVGDLKQAIYRFRLADPTIFLQKYRSFADYEDAQDGEPRMVSLSKNFRSRAEILDACNTYFSRVMSEQLGDIDYTEREHLYLGAAYDEIPEQVQKTEFVVLDLEELRESEEGELPPVAREVEGRYIASRIKEMIDTGFEVTERGEKRPVRYGDIVILMRSLAGKAEIYERALAAFNIPCVSGKGEGLLGTVEVTMILSYLAVIDNPLQDIPLISVLRSPMFGFSADDLSFVRRQASGTFYDALVRTARCEGETAYKCREFLKMTERLNDLSRELSCDRLIWQMYHLTGARGLIGAMNDGTRRVRHLEQFYQYASMFERAGFRGLHSFLTHITQIIERGGELDAGSEDMLQDAVRIMTIHKSKGLEFPVVFLADCNRQFNRADLTEQALIHPELGIGLKYRDYEHRVEYPTLARAAVALALEREMKSEEIRVLYVGLTRAKEKMILVCTLPRAATRIQKLIPIVRGKQVAPIALFGSNKTDLWFLLPLLGMAEGNVLREYAGALDGFASDATDAFAISVVNGGKVPQGDFENKYVQEAPVVADCEQVEELKRRFTYQYPHERATQAPSKLTATEMYTLEHSVSERRHFKRPQFIQKQGLSPTERGIAMHLVMQMIDFSKCQSLDGVKTEILRLENGMYLSREQAEAVDARKIYAFFQSSVGAEVLAGENLEREFRFSVLVPAGELAPGEEILLQGVVDLFYETEEGLVVVDFKSDHVNREQAYSRVEEKYAEQIKTYDYAIREITGREVVRRILYFLVGGFIIEC